MAPKNNVQKYFTKINKTEVKAHFKPKNINIKKTDMLSKETLQPSTSKRSENK